MNRIKIVFFIILLTFIAPCFLIAQEKDFSSFEEMRSSFKESFDDKTSETDDWDIEVKTWEKTVTQDQEDDDYSWQPHEIKHIRNIQTTHNFMGFIPLLLAIWVAWDSSKIGAKAGQAPGFPDFGPVGWFFLTLCCWCIGFPFYLSKRSRYIEANTKSQTCSQESNQESN